MEAALKFLNFGYTEKGAELYNWGVEGINWDWQGEERVYNDIMLNNEKFGTEVASYIYKVHFAPKINYPDVECHANLLKSEGALNSRLMWAEDDKSDSSLQLPPFQLSEEDQQTVAEIATPIYTYADEMTLKFITGAEPLENFEAFRDTIRSMGMPLPAVILCGKGGGPWAAVTVTAAARYGFTGQKRACIFNSVCYTDGIPAASEKTGMNLDGILSACPLC